MPNNFNDPEGIAYIGSDTKEVSNEEPKATGFNDQGGGFMELGKQVVENRNPPTAGFNDDSTIVDGAHMSG